MVEYLEFLQSQGAPGIFRLFWFYFLFEFPRYLVLDFYGIFLFMTRRTFGRKHYREARQKLWTEMPFVSIIVPGKDEGDNYYMMLRTLEEQTYQNFEVIIVDDGSEDQSATIGRSLEKSGRIDLFLTNDVRGGKASAANLAYRYSRGEFIVHLDADSSLNRDALERILIPFQMNEEIGAVGGNIEVRNKDYSLSTLFQTIEYLFTIYIARTVSSSLGILRIISGAFGAFKREALEKVGGWDVGPGLDGDLTLKIRKLGYKIHFEPLATILTSVPDSFGKLVKQRIRWNRSLIRFRLRKHLDFFSPDHGFSLLNFISVFENIFFNVVLNVFWWIYLLDLVFNFTPFALYILITSYIIYTLSKLIEFIGVLLIHPDRFSLFKYIMYVPGMVFYTGYFMRTVRSIAYISELIFKDSYRDPWNPRKTSAAAYKLEERLRS